MGLPWNGRMVHRHGPTALPMLPHLHTAYAGRMQPQNSKNFPHNSAILDMSSTDVTTDAARSLADAIANPATAAPFARFGAHTMDAIRQLADIFLQLAHQHHPPPHPQGAPVQLYRYLCCIATMASKHLQGFHPQFLNAVHQGHPQYHYQGWIPHNATNPTGTPCARAHRPTIQWRP